MKICKINEKTFPAFERYIPDMYREVLKRKNFLVLGFFDENGAHGASICYFYDGMVEIESCIYDDDVEEGVCEMLTHEGILKQGKDIDEIVYVKQGTAEELEAFDYVMMNLEYLPRDGEVTRYEATLGEIMKSQEKTLEQFDRVGNADKYIRGDKLNAHQIAVFNNEFSDNPYIPSEVNPELCMFYMKNDIPAAGIYGVKKDENTLCLTWMNIEDDEAQMAVVGLIFSQLLNAVSLYPEDTKVIICPFMDEVVRFITKLGFKESEDEDKKTKIYTFYF